MGTVLIVEDQRSIREGLVRAIASGGHEAIEVGTLAEARGSLAGRAVDCILLDIRLRGEDGLAFLSELRSVLAPQVPVVMATAFSDSERTIQAMRAGAYEYVTKPFNVPRLLEVVDRAVRDHALSTRAVAAAEIPAHSKRLLLGTSEAMLPVWKTIGRAAASAAAVLITGETGTGKELVARAIHEHSARSAGPFVAVSLAALPATLLESELFGHEKGAFTGAAARRAGRLELARGGTLFLDEIGELDASLQGKLLRVLQEGRFERVGGAEEMATDARVLAATNKLVRPGDEGAALRPELYYRLAVIEIELPPLRARRSDIPLLVNHFLLGSGAFAVTEAAMEKLVGHDWPGNVRELQHVVKRAAAMCGGEIIDVPDLPRDLGARPGVSAALGDLSEGLTMRQQVAALERRLIAGALRRADGNRAQAARLLGVARPQLYAKMKELGLGSSDDGEGEGQT